jgi:sulfatase maturation enzyme AslB (radical SAM superfamily)
VKEYFFTGGEPFLNPEMVPILVETLKFGPATVLTNATVFKDAWLKTLQSAERESIFSLEFRVSIDGFTPETNDPIRGEGTFVRAMNGVKKLVEYGFLPIITAARTWNEEDELNVIHGFQKTLHNAGYARPRIKILPSLKIGAEENRTRGYTKDEYVSEELLNGFDMSQFICEHSRIVTDRGVHICPILIESPDSLMGQDLKESLGPYELRHGACYTCYQYGAICSNPSSSSGNWKVKDHRPTGNGL